MLGLAFGLAAVVGSVVGQGILRSPGTVALASDSATILIGLWLVGSLAAFVSAVSFAEVGAAIPNAGGGIAFAERAFGPRAGVVMAIMLLVSYVTQTAMLAFVVGEFLARLGVGGGQFGPGMLALACLALFAALNAAGTRANGGAQIVLSAAKGFVLIGLVLVLFAQPGAVPSPSPLPSAPTGTLAAYSVAMLLIVGTYNGWADLVFYGEEMRDPGRSVPRAMLGGIAGVTVLYLLVNLALFHVLSPRAMAGSEFAAADAAAGIFGVHGDTAFTAFGVLSVGAITNLSVMTTSRLVFAAARDGILPRKLNWVSKRGTPMPAMLTSTLCAAMFLISGTYLALSSITVAIGQLVAVVVIASCIALRTKEPDLNRPFRVPLYPFTAWLALLINLVLLAVFVFQDPFYSLLGIVLVAAISVPYFALKGRPNRVPTPVEQNP